MTDYEITADDVAKWTSGLWENHAHAWLAEILNGKYGVHQAREDCLSVIRPVTQIEVESTEVK